MMLWFFRIQIVFVVVVVSVIEEAVDYDHDNDNENPTTPFSDGGSCKTPVLQGIQYSVFRMEFEFNSVFILTPEY